MAVVFIPGGAPSYNILSTDITAGSTVDSVSYIGALVRALDTGKTYMVQPDLTLIEFNFPVHSSGESGSATVLGAVSITGSLPALSGTTGTSESWRVSLISDTTGSQSSKTFTVPASTEYQVLWIWVDYTTGSTVGNRQLAVQTQSSASVVTANWARTSVTLASGSTRSYLFASGVADLLGFRDTDYLTTPIPAGSFLSAGQKLKIFDNKAIATTQDTMNIQMQIASRTV